MQSRNMVVMASLSFFLGVLLWGMQTTVFHLNRLLPPAQSVRAYQLEKFDEGVYRVELLGESFKVKLPGGDKVITNVKEYLSGVPIEKMTDFCREWLREIRTQSSKAFDWLSRQWEIIEKKTNLEFHLQPPTSYIDTLYI